MIEPRIVEKTRNIPLTFGRIIRVYDDLANNGVKINGVHDLIYDQDAGRFFLLFHDEHDPGAIERLQKWAYMLVEQSIAYSQKTLVLQDSDWQQSQDSDIYYINFINPEEV